MLKLHINQVVFECVGPVMRSGKSNLIFLKVLVTELLYWIMRDEGLGFFLLHMQQVYSACVFSACVVCVRGSSATFAVSEGVQCPVSVFGWRVRFS